jgi:hypothetical protein
VRRKGKTGEMAEIPMIGEPIILEGRGLVPAHGKSGIEP